jgi:hypothetical protein
MRRLSQSENSTRELSVMDRPRTRVDISGIYAITHVPSGKVYIGSSGNVTYQIFTAYDVGANMQVYCSHVCHNRAVGRVKSLSC